MNFTEEIEALEAKSKYTSRTDEKIVSELTELKDYVYSLKRERDRISREVLRFNGPCCILIHLL